jgi:beta-N-acetylhexosaminidase
LSEAAARVVAGFAGPEVDEELRELLRLGVGGVILFSRNIEGPDQVAELIAEIRGVAGRPLLFAVDQEGGRVARLREPLTVWPDASAFAASGDPQLARAAGAALSLELRCLGFNMNFAPVLDVLSLPTNPVIGPRAFGEDAAGVRAFAGAWLEGAHGAPMGTCGKHFPGHGHTDQDSHHTLPVCDLPAEALLSEHARPFADLAPHLDAFMTAHVLYPALDPRWPATLSPAVLQELARDGLGFGGLIVTDDLEMAAMADQGAPREVAHRALLAGNDLLLVCRDPAFVEEATAACRDRASQPAGRAASDAALARRRRFLDRVPDAGPWLPERRRQVLGCEDHRSLAARLLRHAPATELESPVASV